MHRSLAVCLVLALAAQGPGSGAAAAQDGLAVSAWRVVSVGPRVVPTGVEPVVRFGEGGELSGSGGCNRFSGTYVAGSDEVTIGPLAATRMACPGAAMEIEEALLSELGRVRRYEVRGDELFLSNGAGTNLVTLVQMPWE